MKVAYIAGQYRASTIHGLLENIRNAEQVAIKYWGMGYAVICPHKNTALLDGAVPDTVFLHGDIEILSRCNTIVMMEGWELSEGARNELDHARQLGLEIILDGSRLRS